MFLFEDEMASVEIGTVATTCAYYTLTLNIYRGGAAEIIARAPFGRLFEEDKHELSELMTKVYRHLCQLWQTDRFSIELGEDVSSDIETAAIINLVT